MRRATGGSAFDAARDVSSHVVGRASKQTSKQTFTLLRFSEAASGSMPKLLKARTNDKFSVEFEKLQSEMVPTELATGPLKAIESVEKMIQVGGKQKATTAAKSLIQVGADENLVVYIISDFRSHQWRESNALRQALSRMNDKGAQVQLVQCVDRVRPNLGITALRPTPGARAAGVYLRMEVEVTNFGSTVARDIRVGLSTKTHDATGGSPGTTQSLDALSIDRIDPGASAIYSFPVRFPKAGSHEVTARLATDALAVDNQRFCVVDIDNELPVLIIDGKDDSFDAFVLTLGLESSNKVNTGIRAHVKSPTFLRDHELDPYYAVFLVNIQKLDKASIESLERYIAGGGGVAMFVGDTTDRDFMNKALYREGEGAFPLPLLSPASLLVDQLEETPDIKVTDPDHPIFKRTLANNRNSLLDGVLVHQYFAAPRNWEPRSGSDTRVLAQLRNGAPLFVEREFGKGRFLAVLTTVSKKWNTWASDPTSFLIIAELQSHLASTRQTPSDYVLGAPLRIDLPLNKYEDSIEFKKPVEKGTATVTVRAQGDTPKRHQTEFNDTLRSGIYEAKLTQAAGGVSEYRRFALNIQPEEGDLEIFDQQQIQSLLKDIPHDYREASEFLGPIEKQAGVNLGEHWFLFIALVCLLMGEQILAYSASYHPARKGGSR